MDPSVRDAGVRRTKPILGKSCDFANVDLLFGFIRMKGELIFPLILVIRLVQIK